MEENKIDFMSKVFDLVNIAVGGAMNEGHNNSLIFKGENCVLTFGKNDGINLAIFTKLTELITAYKGTEYLFIDEEDDVHTVTVINPFANNDAEDFIKLLEEFVIKDINLTLYTIMKRGM